jgi:hypothetical protein
MDEVVLYDIFIRGRGIAIRSWFGSPYGVDLLFCGIIMPYFRKSAVVLLFLLSL